MGLPWIRVDVGFLRNPKLSVLRRNGQYRAIVLHLSALLYCGEHGTDGFISRDIAADLGAKPADIEALTAENLWWKDGEAGWSINGWSDKQQTSVESEARSNRMRAAANARWHPKEGGGK